MTSKTTRERPEITVANIVGSGDLNVELDLTALHKDEILTRQPVISSVEHSRRRGNRLNIRYNIDASLGVLAPTGIYIITGATSRGVMEQARRAIVNALVDVDMVTDPPEDFEVRNLVCTADIGKDLNLNKIMIELGMENVEYEPEQFPAAVYRSPSVDCTILIFSTGKVVITGVLEEETAEEALDSLMSQIRL